MPGSAYRIPDAGLQVIQLLHNLDQGARPPSRCAFKNKDPLHGPHTGLYV